MRRAQGMPARLTNHQRNLFMAKRRGGSSQEAAAAAGGMSVRSARRIERNQLQPQANQPRGRPRPDPLAGVWDEELVPLLQRSPALSPVRSRCWSICNARSLIWTGFRCSGACSVGCGSGRRCTARIRR